MANPTTNFGWVMPSATDLVTDLPADFDVFGQAVDTDFVGLKGGTTGQVLAKASGTDLDFVWSADAAGMTNPMTTTADIIYSSSGSTPARLGIGSTNDVLTVAGGVPTWAAPSGGGGANYSLLNAGGTALSGTTTTVSGISGKENLIILVTGLKMSTSLGAVNLRINADSGSNYRHATNYINAPATYASSNIGSVTSQTADSIPFSNTSGNTNSALSGSAIIEGCNTDGLKVISTIAGSTAGGGNDAAQSSGVTLWNNSATITSVSVISDYTMNAGTIYVYATA